MYIKVLFQDDSLSLSAIKPYLSILPKDRRDKIARYRFEKDKVTSALSGLMIRQETGGRELCRNAYGKLYVKDSVDLFFSISHSGSCVAVATDREEVGVDIERIRDKGIDKLAHRFFCENEQAYISNSANPPLAFTEIWTRKEAYLKWKGTGITEELMTFDTLSSNAADHLFTVPMEGYVLSVCSSRKFFNDKPKISIIELSEILPRSV